MVIGHTSTCRDIVVWTGRVVTQILGSTVCLGFLYEELPEMPKPEKVTNRNAIPQDGNPRVSTDPGDLDYSSLPVVLELSTKSGRYQAAFDALCYLYGLDLGWVRIAPQDHGKVVYYKYKFVRGRWKAHYVMYRDDSSDPVEAFCRLASKVTAVLAGEARPALDSYYEDQ